MTTSRPGAVQKEKMPDASKPTSVQDLSDVLRYGEPLTVPGPFLADVLGSLELALEDECPTCVRLQSETDRLGVLCGICSVRDKLVERLYDLARDEQYIQTMKAESRPVGRPS